MERESTFAHRRDICDFSINVVLNLVESPLFTVTFSKQKVRGLLDAHKYYARARVRVPINKLWVLCRAPGAQQITSTTRKQNWPSTQNMDGLN